LSNSNSQCGQTRPARRCAAPVRAGLIALLVTLGAGIAGCSTQPEIVRMPRLTGLPIQPLPLPEPTAVMSNNQKDAAIADMQAAARKNASLTN